MIRVRAAGVVPSPACAGGRAVRPSDMSGPSRHYHEHALSGDLSRLLRQRVRAACFIAEVCGPPWRGRAKSSQHRPSR